MDTPEIILDLTRSGKIERLDHHSKSPQPLLATIRQLEETLGRSPKDLEVANALGISYQEFSDLVKEALSAEQTYIPKSPQDASSFQAIAARHLSRQEQLVVMLHYVEGLENAEIAMVLGLGEKKVRHILVAIKKRLLDCE